MPLITNKIRYAPLMAVPLFVSTSILLGSQAVAAPTANPDNYTTTVNQSITVSPLSNDLADTGTTLVVEVVNSPSPWGTGTTTLSDNKVTYTPPEDFTGTTEFWYGIKDSRGLITSAPIKVTVTGDTTPSTDYPPQASPNSATTTSGQTITIDAVANDEGNGLEITKVDNPAPYPSGSAEIVNNKIRYTAPADFAGTSTFWYQIKDSRGLLTSAPITVTVEGDEAPPVSYPPQAHGDVATTTSGQTITIDTVANDVGDGLFITKVDNPAPYPSGSAAIVNNKINYTAPADFVGESSFWYQIKDSQGRLTSNVIVVTVNGATETSPYPTAGNDTAQTTQDAAITIAPLWNDTGAELKITAVDGTTTQGSKTQIIGTDKILYTPSIWSGAGDTFWYVITDKFGRTNAAKIVVAVTDAVDDGAYPTAGSDNYTVEKDSTGNVFNIFDNDTGNGLTFNQLYSYSAKGGRTYDNNGSVRYDAPPGFVGTDDFWYSMKDSIGRTNSAKVTITVQDTVDPELPNAAPDAVEDALRASINGAEFEIDVLANDTDPNNDTLSVQSVDPARAGSVRLVNGRVLYTPPSFTTSDTFVYTISDGRGGTDSTAATIGVIDPNNPTTNPTINDESVTVAAGESVVIRVLDNDSDPDGDTLRLDQVTGGSQGTTEKIADNNGNLNWVRYTAIPEASGTDEFYYGVEDGLGGNGSGKVTITIR